MVTVWYECSVCQLAYPHEDEALECEQKHGPQPITVLYGGEPGLAMTRLNSLSGMSGISGIDGWTGQTKRKPKKLKH